MTSDRATSALAGAVVAAAVAAIALWRDLDTALVVVAALVGGAVTVIADVFLPRLVAESSETAESGPPTEPLPGGGQPTLAPPRTPDESTATPPPPHRSSGLDPASLVPDSVETRTFGPKGRRGYTLRIAKHGSSLAECEDAVAVDERRSIVAVGDGASSSFGAGPWAAALAAGFVANPPRPLSIDSFDEFLERCRGSEQTDDRDAATGWWADEGQRRGAYSTIIGAGVTPKGKRRHAMVMCVGDSCGFLLRGERGARQLRRSLPYEDSGQFGSHPFLLGSLGTTADAAQPLWTVIPVEPGDLIVLASDALSEWLLDDVARFANLETRSPGELAELLIEQRASGAMVNDDLALVALEVA